MGFITVIERKTVLSDEVIADCLIKAKTYRETYAGKAVGWSYALDNGIWVLYAVFSQRNEQYQYDYSQLVPVAEFEQAAHCSEVCAELNKLKHVLREDV
jgi:hypothetical protein